MNNQTEFSIRPGRPREFDTDAVLDKAITLFSEYGYHGTSISDLKKYLGLTSGSIYKAWGDKRGLFMAALDRYMMLRGEATANSLASKHSGLEKIEALLMQYARLSSEAKGRTGCLVIASAVELSLADNEVAALILNQQVRREVQICRLIKEGQSDGSIRRELNADTLAKLILTVQQGMRVVGKTGAETKDMLGIVVELMRLFE